MNFEPKAPFHKPFMVFAKPGDLVLFPSWLLHKVPPHKGKDHRVVFPFNFHLGTTKPGQIVWDGWARTA